MKNRLPHRRFPVNIAKFLRSPILNNICEQLLREDEVRKASVNCTLRQRSTTTSDWLRKAWEIKYEEEQASMKTKVEEILEFYEEKLDSYTIC